MEISITNAIKKFYRNASFPMLIVEAVANAIDAEATKICINLCKKGDKPKSVTIEDNGVGFDGKRYKHFSELLNTEDDKHKGVGRLVYLHYFDTIQFDSTFKHDNKMMKRSFEFTRNFSYSKGKKTIPTTDVNAGTKVIFKDFNGERIGKKDFLQSSHYKEILAAHFFYSLINNPNLEISIKTSESGGNIMGDDTAHIKAEDLNFEEKEINISWKEDSGPNLLPEEADVIHKFTLRHAYKKQEKSKSKEKSEIKETKQVFAVLVSDNRSYPVNEKKLAIQVPVGYSFYFALESEYLDNRSTDDRNRLIDIPNSLYEDLEREICVIVKEKLPEIETNKKTDLAYIESRYPHLIGYCNKNELGIQNRKKLIEKAQQRFFEKQRSILDKKTSEFDKKDYDEIFKISSDTLAQYILFRNFTIGEFRKLEEDPQQRKDELTLHNKLIPFSRSEKTLYNTNLWVIDDRFMTYSHALSNSEIKTLMKSIDSSTSQKDQHRRPDISLVFSKNPKELNGNEKVQLAIIELKALGASNQDKLLGNDQILDYAETVIKNENYKGKIDSAWFYLITELDEEIIRKFKRNHGYVELFSLGETPVLHAEFTKELPVPVSVFILSMSSLVKDAKARNQIFLDILKGKHNQLNPETEMKVI